MKVFVIQAIYLTGFLSITTPASYGELTKSGPRDHQEESGVMTHGTIVDIGEEQIAILSSTSREPIRYSHGEGTVYVDESGNPITLKVLRSGVAVTVFYLQAEDRRIANRVIVGESRPLRSS